MCNDDKVKILNLLKTSKGQIDGIIKMIDDDRYCVDISKQILAVSALLKKTNLSVLDQHIRYCVKEAFLEGKGEEKVEEIIGIIGSYIK